MSDIYANTKDFATHRVPCTRVPAMSIEQRGRRGAAMRMPRSGRAGSFAYVGRAVPVRPLGSGAVFFWLCAWLYFLSEPGDCIRERPVW